MAKDTTSTPQGGTTTAGKDRAPGRTRNAPASSTGSRPAAKASTSKSQSSSGLAQRRLATPSLAAFVRDSYAELLKVTWPTRQETLNLTLAVIVMTVSIAIFLGLIDGALDALVKPLLAK